MATVTPNFNWPVPTSTDLVKDGATAIEALGVSIYSSLVDLKGGTTGQVLSKTSGTDMDFTWVTSDDANAIQNTIVDAKGDLIAATAADTPARLAVGTNGHVLTADSTAATGIKWAAPAGGGKIAQVVSTTKTDTFTLTSGTYTDVTGLSVSITPTSATSKILIMVSMMGHGTNSGGATGDLGGRLVRDSTAISIGTSTSTRIPASVSVGSDASTSGQFFSGVTFLDSPATTSATTYKMQVKANGGSGTIYVNRSLNDVDDPAIFRPVSSITVMEVLA
jgi:hypothetical protein